MLSHGYLLLTSIHVWALTLSSLSVLTIMYRSAKGVAQRASRVFGIFIAKCRFAGGVPYNVFIKLTGDIGWPVVSYGTALRGFMSCLLYQWGSP